MNDHSNQINMTITLEYQKPFSFQDMLVFLQPRAIRGVEVVTAENYSRTFRLAGVRGYFVVEQNSNKSALLLHIHCGMDKCSQEISLRVRRMFDLDTDFEMIKQKLGEDPLLARGMEQGQVPRLPLAFDPFECVVRAILGQQISVKAATTLAGRVVEKAAITCGDSYPDGLTYHFPSPSEILELQLDGLGITTTRQKTIQTVTQAVIDKAVHLTESQSYLKFHKDFSSLKGIGEWTVNYVAMRALGMVDSFPATDLGVIKAMTGNGKVPSQKEILATAEAWRPYRSYATLCLWNYENKKDQV